MSDPLGGAQNAALADAKELVTETYVPWLLGAVVFGALVRIGFKWFRRGVKAAGG